MAALEAKTARLVARHEWLVSARVAAHINDAECLELCRELPEDLGTFLEYKGRPATGRVTATLAGGFRVIAFQANVV
jgi:hypothetical protein